MMSGELEARTPRTTRWTFRGVHPVNGAHAHVFEHRHDGTRVLSALELAEAPDGSCETIPQWHISISQQGHRPDADVVDRALRAFDMVGADEDNHHPGIARHFWLPVDPARRVECECKTTEDTVVDRDGYAWTNPKPETGEACRGCEIAPITKKPCPIHGATRPIAGGP
jgi:hypothetical protein